MPYCSLQRPHKLSLWATTNFSHFHLQKQDFTKRINNSATIDRPNTATPIPTVINIAQYQVHKLQHTVYSMSTATKMQNPTISSNQVLSPLRLSAPIHLSRNFTDFNSLKLINFLFDCWRIAEFILDFCFFLLCFC